MRIRDSPTHEAHHSQYDFIGGFAHHMLEEAIRRYQNRAIETLQAIEELIELAGKMCRVNERAEALGLTEEELAFYNALDPNDRAVKLLGDRALCELARELTAAVRSSVSIDWSARENVRAGLRVTVEPIRRRYGYPPEKRDQAAKAVLAQAEAMTDGGWGNSQ